MEEKGDEPSEAPPDYQLYADIPDWSNVPPPPTYEEAVIHGINTSTEHPQPEGTTLGYVDFLPRLVQPGPTPVFEEFRVLMTMANTWLLNQPNYAVLRCESIERKLKKNSFLETESTIQHTPAFGINPFIIGLRLWLTYNASGSQPQQIWYMNVLPKPIAQTIYYGRGYRHGFNGYAMTMRKTTVYPDFEDLDKTLERLNERLKESPIPGSVLNVDCKDMKYCSNMWDPKIYDPYKHTYNPDTGYWGNTKDGVLYLTVLRIFFVRGPPQPVQIGLQDFNPACERYVSGGKPIFEPMSRVMAMANNWITQNRAIRVTNIGSLQTKVTHNIFARGTDATDKIEYNTRCTFYSGNFEVTYVNFIRVAYVTPGTHDYLGLSLRTFVPTRYPGNHGETLSELLQRINTWLAVTGAKIRTADTLQINFDPGVLKAIDMEKSSSTVPASRGVYWITVIQLYLNGGYVEPPPEVLPPAPDFVTASDSSSSCSIL